MSEINLKIYRGYANEQQIHVFGHVLRNTGVATNSFDQSKWWYAFKMIQMFTVKPIKGITVQFNYNGIKGESTTKSDGYFQFTIPLTKKLEAGWHNFEVSVLWNNEVKTEVGEFFMAYPGRLGIISDIDDTFLISHSGSFFKKLYVLLTRNIHRRKIFEDVVHHYRMLSSANRVGIEKNLFFYVSSSEWNLYDFITKFTALHDFPKAVIKLKEIKKGLIDFLVTGRGNHNHKLLKIQHILTFYPDVQFILLGDDSQKDPLIYHKIVTLFPDSIKAIYIRQTRSKKKQHVLRMMKDCEDTAIHYCYFKDSKTAISHSKKIGLID
ncbi:App1 family protein [Aquimarina brevivitae]|uniref:Phosphatidate phosphatase APP1 n=1 Tax=Aquimarina brevivitae TaxID=323412 RepID=A0A4Q7PJ86_9FLAO|nr:App1 family protein [Aquimarina brevivitae]RZT00109.1 phosphatidate phosphatase APP1 [Aquimarina brevivitae]